MDIHKLSAIEISSSVRKGELKAVDVAKASFARIEKHDGAVKAFLSLDKEGALAAAAAVDRKVAAGQGGGAGLLAGVPVAIKDNLCVSGLSATCASKILENYRPPYDAHVIERIKAEGGVIVGKTNLDEFAMGSSTENSAWGATRNPWDTACAPGGSSGGSAAAVAAGFVPLALGSDTGGSIRQPASFCGCVGMKPTYGMVSRYGLIAFGSSLDQIGPFARSVEDAALLMDVVSGHDRRDSTSADRAKPDFLAALKGGGGATGGRADGGGGAGVAVGGGGEGSLKGLRVGVPGEYFGEGLDPEVKKLVEGAIAKLKDLGASVCDVALPHTKYGVPVYYIVATAEASSNLARYDGAHYGHRAQDASDIIELYSRSREEGFGAEVKRRIMLGTYVLSAGYYDAYYLRGLKVRTLIAKDFKEAFAKVDVIATPTSPTVAFRMGEKSGDPLSMYLSDIYTIGVNLAGIPGISVNCGFSKNLPVGVQLLANHFDDARLLSVSAALEQALGTGGKAAPLA